VTATQRKRIQGSLASSLSGQTQRAANANPKSEIHPITIRDSSRPNYVLVTYGEKYEHTKHPFGLTITVARQKSKTVSELSFLTAVRTAKGIAKQEGISEIFACK
jgi:hypothetical protein